MNAFKGSLEPNKITLPHAWWIFIQQRFDPFSNALMIAVFVGAHARISHTPLSSTASIPVIVLFFGVLTFFFKLRLYDEIKDYTLDCQINPNRPLPRGILKIPQVHIAILLCMGLELGCFATQGWNSFSAMVFALCYSLLMYNEFFVSSYIRKYLTTYALVHTASCGLLSLAILCFLSQKSLVDLPSESLFFALASWCIFNVFEFGRKTFAKSEERENVESYSQVWGRFGAVLLVAIMSTVAAYSMTQISNLDSFNFKISVGSLFGIVLFSGTAYSLLNTQKSARFYRGACSLFIIFIFLFVIFFSI